MKTHKSKRDFVQEQVDIVKLFDHFKNKYQTLDIATVPIELTIGYFETKTLLVNLNPHDWIEYDENENQTAVGSCVIVKKKDKRLDIRLNSYLKKKQIIFNLFDDYSIIVHFGKFDLKQIITTIEMFLM